MHLLLNGLVFSGYRVLFVFSCLLVVSCASVQTRLPMPDTSAMNVETSVQTKAAFARLLSQQQRLDRVAARILQANAGFCKKTRLDFGITTKSLKSYPKHIRASAARELGVREEPTVLFVRKDSPAAKAGVRRGDEILGAQGRPVSAFDKSLKDAKVLHIRRDGKSLNLPIQGIRSCAVPVRLKTSSAINAWADGKHITVTTAMMDFVRNDRELALVLGHELAHNTMGHIKKAIWNTIISGFATRTTRPFEAEADYVGLYYMARAGYEMDGVEEVWRRLGILFPKSVVRAKSHPVTPERLLAIRMTAREIRAKQKAGAPLLPNRLKPTHHN